MTAARQEALRAILFMFTLSLVLITGVSSLSLLTAKRVARNANLVLQRAVMEVTGVLVSSEADAISAWFSRAVRIEPDDPMRMRVLDPDTGKTHTLVFQRTVSGLWGKITAVVGVDPATGLFRQIRIIDQNETPGLGARITEPWFQNQMAGKRGPFTLVPEGTRSNQANDLDAITGATVTSTAIRDLLNGIVRDRASRLEAGK